jgi:hypothetical protein
VHKITNTNKTDNVDETAWTVSTTTQESVHAAMDYALKAQEINIELLRRSSQVWIESFRYQATLSQGMAQAFFGQWGNVFASTTQVERPAREQSNSEVTEPATNGTQKDTGVAAEEARQKGEKERAAKVDRETRKAERAAEETQEATETAAQDAEETNNKRTGTATFPIEGYDEMNVDEVSEHLDALSVDELKRVRRYEKDNKNRRYLRKEMKQKIKITA